MLRRLATVAAGLLVLAVVAGGLLVGALNRLLDAKREQIVAGMSGGFGRPVTIGHVTAGFHRGVAVELHDLAIGEDPVFGTEPFLTAAEVHAVVDIGPLLRGRIEVRRIVAVSPRVTVVRTAHGMNVDSLGRRPRTPANAPAAKTAPAERASAGVPAAAIVLVNLEDATVRYVDRSGGAARETTIAPLALRLTDVSLTAPVGYDLRATVQGQPPTTIHVRGVVGPVGDPPFAADVPLEQRVTIAGGSVDVPALVVAGTLRRDEVGRPIANVRVTAAAIVAGGVALSDLEIAGTERDGTAALETLEVGVFGGTITGKGRVAHAKAPLAVAFETSARGLDVAAAVASRAPDAAAAIEGRLDADWQVTAAGDDEAAVRRSLAGKGRVVVRDGAIKDVNVADRVLMGVTGVVGFGALAPAKVRNRYPEIFSAEDTRFDQLTADVRIGGEQVTVESVVVSARDYTLRGKGVLTFAQYVDVTATFAASERLTADLVSALGEARVLVDDAGRLSIPFRFVGTLPHVRPKPDEEFLARILEKAIVGEGLERLLGGPRRDGGKGDAGGKGAKEDEAKKLLQKGLDKLFGR